MTFHPLHWRAAHALPAGLLALGALAMLQHGPIVQPTDYHHFADQRGGFGIAHAADVWSNLVFVIVGLYGLRQARASHALFFAAILLTAFGSAWYHLAPDNARLVWDRLPIALACAALLAAVWRETAGASRKLPAALAGAAVASVAWWRYTDLNGAGDLRPYLLLQLAPIVLIPLLQWRHGRPRRERLAYGAALTLYLLAKLCEVADHGIFAALAVVSGHTLKHLLAGAAAGIIAWAAPRIRAATFKNTGRDGRAAQASRPERQSS
ncbi:hypothetical protein AAKU55_003395 [Oxalobacteraceae bacterium GrIS 1.11]